MEGPEKEHPPYVPMRGEVQQKTCRGFDPNATWKEWEWTPDADCEFLNSEFDEEMYCSLAKNKTIAIVGDSISLDHFLSLKHFMGVPQALPRARNKGALLVSNICNGTSRLIGKRDFFLQSVSDINKMYEPDVLILNRGAHYTPDGDLLNHLKQTLIPQIFHWQNDCEAKGKICNFVWRTTVPGHPDCGRYSKPSDSIEDMEQIIANTSLFNWREFRGQNELVLDALQENVAFDMMDSYSINILRPDVHVPPGDCLHTVCTYHSLAHFFTVNYMHFSPAKQTIRRLLTKFSSCT